MNVSDWLAEKPFGDGVITIHKPYGMPSTAITNLFKRSSQQKVGHGGTLDPLAEGAMILGIGKGTKKLSLYLESTKKYRTVIIFDVSTQSEDLEWPVVIAEAKETIISRSNIDSILRKFSLGYQQEISAFSAVKVNGKSQFTLAHKGAIMEPAKITETKLLTSEVHSLKRISSVELEDFFAERQRKLGQTAAQFTEVALQYDYNTEGTLRLIDKWLRVLGESKEVVRQTKRYFAILELEVTVPKGTYIRSLAVAIAKELGTTAVLGSLERLRATS